MTNAEFVEAAYKKKIVRWSPSGVIERLMLRHGVVYGVNLITGQRHPMRNLHRMKEIHCTVIDLSEKVVIKDLLGK